MSTAATRRTAAQIAKLDAEMWKFESREQTPAVTEWLARLAANRAALAAKIASEETMSAQAAADLIRSAGYRAEIDGYGNVIARVIVAGRSSHETVPHTTLAAVVQWLNR